LQRKFKPHVDASRKTLRYRPGKAPKWAPEAQDEDDEVFDKWNVTGRKGGAEEKEKVKGFSDKGPAVKDKEKEKEKDKKRKRREPLAAVVLESKDSRPVSRLERLKQTASNADLDPSDRLVRHRALHEARVIEAADEQEKLKAEEEENERLGVAKKEELDLDTKPSVAELQIPMYDDVSGDEKDDNDLRTQRRDRIREAALLKRKEEELKEEINDLGEEDEDDESSYEDESDDDPRRGALLKPVFVSKSKRETVREKEAKEKAEEEAKERAKERNDERKAESKTLLVDTIRAAEEAEAAGLNENDRSDIELLDDDDEKNEAEEYELWKIRELKRIKRDKEERLERVQELEFIEKRRRMTDAERAEDDKKLDGKATKREEVKNFSFLQKYYHRGGFFQDKAASGDEPLYNRDFHEPTEEEKFDKQLLPQAMQVRRGQFGKKGQVKHTHLTDVDTTDMSAAWAQHSKVMQKYQERMAGPKGKNVFDRDGMSGAGSSSRIGG